MKIRQDQEVSEADDEQFLQNLFTELSIGNIKANTMKRIGAQREENNRPILVQMKNEEEKGKVMNNLKNLATISRNKYQRRLLDC